MFDVLVEKNEPPPLSVRVHPGAVSGGMVSVVGSNPALAGLVSVCGDAGIALNKKVALGLGPNWEGPRGIGLNIVQTVFTVGFGAVMGMGAIYIFATIS